MKKLYETLTIVRISAEFYSDDRIILIGLKVQKRISFLQNIVTYLM